ncbi:thiolase family protein [Frankia sp. AgB1.9]|uniref:thiolase C-terminal domain-containing protein n=1 Tax=unclassified Frankia TaxID=2632575 RepID=UPI0019333678|nr:MULTISPECIES: thiolase family protein [unclassified Frankia]MBL7488189.1 thiolase family protein [Frankia sp. AgW1.1]MBL7551656.1 thiolase family protein [Frankia sp. AgB1.9]MBL7620192.1 thiolase family protein [Frankia sp. AgB1.8]
MSALSRDVAIVGVGYSPLSRDGTPLPRRLAYAAVSEALADAGLPGAAVDGIFEYKFGPESPGAQDVARMIGAPNLTAFADIMPTNPSGLAGPLAGVMAVASGVCETVLAFRCLTRAAGHTGGVRTGPDRIGGADQFLTPYGYLGGILMNMALVKQRWMAQYGRGEEDFGRIAVNARRWSALNPRAVLRDPISMDDYLGSRMIADPLRLLDCDYPVNGAVATVITTAERARDLCQRPVLIDSMAYGTGPEVDWIFGADYLYGGTIPCAQRLWERSAFGPADIDVAQIYDGFTSVTLHWLEALGFCGLGESGDWIGNGDRIGPGGELPMNTAGGQLAEGRLHGVSFLNEAVLQLRGQCDARQVPDARVALVASGLYPQCGAMVLTAGS